MADVIKDILADFVKLGARVKKSKREGSVLVSLPYVRLSNEKDDDGRFASTSTVASNVQPSPPTLNPVPTGGRGCARTCSPWKCRRRGDPIRRLLFLAGIAISAVMVGLGCTLALNWDKFDERYRSKGLYIRFVPGVEIVARLFLIGAVLRIEGYRFALVNVLGILIGREDHCLLLYLQTSSVLTRVCTFTKVVVGMATLMYIDGWAYAVQAARTQHDIRLASLAIVGIITWALNLIVLGFQMFVLFTWELVHRCDSSNRSWMSEEVYSQAAYGDVVVVRIGSDENVSRQGSDQRIERERGNVILWDGTSFWDRVSDNNSSCNSMNECSRWYSDSCRGMPVDAKH